MVRIMADEILKFIDCFVKTKKNLVILFVPLDSLRIETSL